MKLITKEIARKLEKARSDSELMERTGRTFNVRPIVVKFFDPATSWTWWATEGEQIGDDWRLFGVVDGHYREWGYWMLSDFRVGRRLLPIERDLHFDGYGLTNEHPPRCIVIDNPAGIVEPLESR